MGFSNPILGSGGALVRPAIKSPNYVAGSTGWMIGRGGDAEFNNAVIRGLLLASAFQTALDGERIEINVDESGSIILFDQDDNEVLRIDATGMTSFSDSVAAALGVGNGLISFDAGSPFLTPMAQMFNDAVNVYLNTQLTGGVAFNAAAAAWAGVVSGGTTLETRHALPYNTNWGSSTTFNGSTNWEPAYYRKDAEDNVVLQGAFKAGATLPGAAVATLPLGYRPTKQWPVLVQRKTGTSTLSMGFAAVSTAGNFNIMTQTGLGVAAGDEYLVSGFIPRGVLA